MFNVIALVLLGFPYNGKAKKINDYASITFKYTFPDIERLTLLSYLCAHVPVPVCFNSFFQ